MEEYPTEGVSYQYPDPDDAAYGARYSWAEEESDHVPAALRQGLLNGWPHPEIDSDDDLQLSRSEWPGHSLELTASQGSDPAPDTEHEEFGHNERRVL